MSASLPFSVGKSLPDLLERDPPSAQVISLPLEKSGASVVPASGTVTIRKSDGSALVSSASVTVTAGVATYSISTGVLPSSLSYSRDWMAEWSLVVDGTTYRIEWPLALVRRIAVLSASVSDMTKRHTELRSWVTDDGPSLQDFLDEAWIELQERLWRERRYPDQALNPNAFRLPTIYLALCLAFRDYHASAGGDGKYRELSEDYKVEYEAAWARLQFRQDLDDDGAPEDGETVSGEGVLFTGGMGQWGGAYRWGRPWNS